MRGGIREERVRGQVNCHKREEGAEREGDRSDVTGEPTKRRRERPVRAVVTGTCEINTATVSSDLADMLRSLAAAGLPALAIA